MRFPTMAAAAVLSLAAFTAQAHEFKQGAITIGHPYARATVPGQPAGGGYLSFSNAGHADRLLSASAEVSYGPRRTSARQPLSPSTVLCCVHHQ